ncbi:MAG TPA: hypothetical protein VNW47_12020 [Terriglobales bacterium]|jgi:hypothetical protein|nr:hypothetical protein [Terriglobales bacterium]
MNCLEVQQALPEMMDGQGHDDLEYQAHLKTCPMCSELVAELELIASTAGQLAEADEPAPRVWVKIAAELRAEGVIRDTEVAGRPVLVPAAKRRWNAWWLVPVAAALVAAGGYFIQPRPAVPVASQDAPGVTRTETAPVVASNEAPRADKAVAAAQNQKSTVAAARDESSSNAPLMTASTSDQKLLDGVSPDMRSAYETQLRAVNAYIRDADAYVRRNPDDEDARQHLMDAYEQREMLYQMALDHVQ